MIKNPIFQRELKTAVRDPKVVCLILGFVALVSVILMFLWPTTGIFSIASYTSLNIFTIFLMSNLALILLLVPALTSPAITTERENNSFDLLFTSLMTPGEILRGKLASALAMILLVVLVSMPVAALCSLSGGIGPKLLLRAYGVIVLSSITYGMLGLALSAVCRNTFTSLILCYVMVAVLAGSTWLPYYLMGRLQGLEWVWILIRSLSPFDALYCLIFPTRHSLTQITSFNASPLLPFYIHLAGMLGLLSFFLFVFCKYIFEPPRAGLIYRWVAVVLAVILVLLIPIEWQLWKIFDRDPGAMGWQVSVIQVGGIIALVDVGLILLIRGLWRLSITSKGLYHDQFEDVRTTVRRKLTWPFYLIDPLRRRRPIGRFRNPVFVAELRSKIFGRPKFIIRGIAACIIASLAILVLVCFQFAVSLNADTVRWVAVIFQLGIVAILAPAISSGSITDELTSRTFKMLRMTPISAVRVVAGKLKAGFLYVSVFLISSIPVLLSLAFLDTSQDEFNVQSLWRVGVWVAILLLTTLAFITAGFCASAFSRSTSGATAISYTFAGILCIVTFAALIPGAFTRQAQEMILTLNPMVAALHAISSDELFDTVTSKLWLNNLIFLGSISVFFIIVSSLRVYRIFTRQQ